MHADIDLRKDRSMVADFALNYMIAEMFCAIILVLVYYADRFVGSRSALSRWFNTALFSLVFYFTLDSVWARVYTTDMADKNIYLAFINLILSLLLNVMSASLFVYILMREGYPAVINSYKGRIISTLPIIILLAFTVIVCFVDIDMAVTKEGEVTDLFNALFIAAPALYCFGASACSVHKLAEKRYDEELRLYLILAVYPVLMLVLGCIEIFLIKVPLFCYAATTGMIYIYITFTTDRMYKDALTGLPNRSAIDNFMIIKSARKKLERYYMYMIDMNGLKSMNDIYGHKEGDEAIKTIGYSLRDAIREFSNDGAACRYGGDEFMAVICTNGDEEAERFLRVLRSTISAKYDRKKLHNEPKIAAGFAHLTSDRTEWTRAKQTADDMMYENKQSMENTGRSEDIYRDSLTGLPSLIYFETHADSYIKEKILDGKTPALIFAGIASMHVFNAEKGYEEGDKLLIKTADILREFFKDELIVRYTDDNFIVITTKTSRDISEAMEEVSANVKKASEDLTNGTLAGVFFCDDPNVKAYEALDRARFTKKFFSKYHGRKCYFYDRKVTEAYHFR
jgi:diguanylate cyclase (GGDEF)-like protein